MKKNSLTTEQWAKIAQRLKDREDREAATYPLTKAMHEENPSQDYVQRLGQARDMVNSCGIENLDRMITLVRQGKMADEIINALKKNNVGISMPVP